MELVTLATILATGGIPTLANASDAYYFQDPAQLVKLQVGPSLPKDNGGCFLTAQNFRAKGQPVCAVSAASSVEANKVRTYVDPEIWLDAKCAVNWLSSTCLIGPQSDRQGRLSMLFGLKKGAFVSGLDEPCSPFIVLCGGHARAKFWRLQMKVRSVASLVAQQ